MTVHIIRMSSRYRWRQIDNLILSWRLDNHLISNNSLGLKHEQSETHQACALAFVSILASLVGCRMCLVHFMSALRISGFFAQSKSLLNSRFNPAKDVLQRLQPWQDSCFPSLLPQFHSPWRSPHRHVCQAIGFIPFSLANGMRLSFKTMCSAV